MVHFAWTGREQEIIDEIIAKEMESIDIERVTWKFFLTKNKFVPNKTHSFNGFVQNERMDVYRVFTEALE